MQSVGQVQTMMRLQLQCQQQQPFLQQFSERKCVKEDVINLLCEVWCFFGRYIFIRGHDVDGVSFGIFFKASSIDSNSVNTTAWHQSKIHWHIDPSSFLFQLELPVASRCASISEHDGYLLSSSSRCHCYWAHRTNFPWIVYIAYLNLYEG